MHPASDVGMLGVLILRSFRCSFRGRMAGQNGAMTNQEWQALAWECPQNAPPRNSRPGQRMAGLCPAWLGNAAQNGSWTRLECHRMHAAAALLLPCCVCLLHTRPQGQGRKGLHAKGSRPTWRCRTSRTPCPKHLPCCCYAQHTRARAAGYAAAQFPTCFQPACLPACMPPAQQEGSAG